MLCSRFALYEVLLVPCNTGVAVLGVELHLDQSWVYTTLGLGILMDVVYASYMIHEVAHTFSFVPRLSVLCVH